MSARRQIAERVFRFRVADGDRRVARSQQRRHRLADDLAAAQDDRVRALDRDLVGVEQGKDAGRRAGHETRPPLDQQADVLRMQAVHVLDGVDRVEDPSRVVPGRQRKLDENPVHRVVPVGPLDFLEEPCGRRHPRQADRLGEAAGFFRGAGLR